MVQCLALASNLPKHMPIFIMLFLLATRGHCGAVPSTYFQPSQVLIPVPSNGKVGSHLPMQMV